MKRGALVMRREGEACGEGRGTLMDVREGARMMMRAFRWGASVKVGASVVVVRGGPQVSWWGASVVVVARVSRWAASRRV